MKKTIATLTIMVCILTLTACGGGGGGGGANPVAVPITDSTDTNLATAYPQIFNSYTVMETSLQDNNKSSDDRIALFSPNIADDFVDTTDGPNKKQELIDSTKSRLERYIINDYKFTPKSHKVIDAETVEVVTDMLIDVNKKENAIGAVTKANIPLPNQTVIWKKYGSEWKIYKGIPYKSSEISI